jgi:hypothetical protein
MSRLVLAIFLGAALASCRGFYVLPDSAADGGPTDGGVADGAAAADGSGATTDAGADAMGALPSPCIDKPASTLLCDDFDTGALGDPWEARGDPATYFSQGSLDTTTWKSSPRSLHVQVKKQGTEQTGYLRKAFTLAAADNVRFEFDLQIHASGLAYPFGVFFGNYSITFNFDNKAIVESIPNQSQANHVTSAVFPEGVWQHVQLDIVRSTAKATFKVGSSSDTFTLTGSSFLTMGACALQLGVYDAGANVTWDASMDNAVLSTF